MSDVSREALSETDQRFWANVTKTETCWLWRGSKRSRMAYGVLTVNGVRVAAHRYAYEQLVGPILEGLQLDHLCRVPQCVNPDHLEPVTLRENVLRGNGHTAHNARKTHCKHGHEFNERNTLITKKGRACRACSVRYQRGRQYRITAARFFGLVVAHESPELRADVLALAIAMLSPEQGQSDE